ncbi:DnaJ family domain-containing protein [Bacillus licheniformis]
MRRASGNGKTFEKDDAAHVPEHLRMAYRVMKNAGMAEDEGALKKELMTIDDLIGKCADEDERERLIERKTETRLRLDRLAEEKACFPSLPQRFIKKKCIGG